MFSVFLLVFGLWFSQAQAQSLLSPERVLLVVNQRGALSRQIARYYAQKRHIPPENILYLDLPLKEEISRPVYLSRLERPLARYLEEKRLQDQILVLVLLPQVPHKIKGRVARQGDAAAVDSELCLLYRKMLYGPYRLGGWLPNPFFRAPLEIPFEHDRFDIYLVTRLSGYDLKDVKGLVDRALEAPSSSPPYTVVLDAKNGPTAPGDNWLHAAYLALKGKPGLVFNVSFDPSFILSASRVMAYASWGSNDPNYPPDRHLEFSFLPGAIGVTFVSTSARTFRRPPPGWKAGASWKAKHRHFAGSPQSLIADLIHQGITGISGNAYEPYLSASARPYLLFPAYLAGDTLAEAYYRSLAYLSWQTVVVGDPLACLSERKPLSFQVKDWFTERKKRFERAQKRKKKEDILFLAKIELLLGFPERALKELKPLLKKDPSSCLALLSQIAVTPELRARVRRLLRPMKGPEISLFLAYLAYEDHQYQTARKYLAPVLDLEPTPAEALFLAGLLARKEKKCSLAIKYLEKAISEAPGRWSLFVSLYQALKECGALKRAAHIREKILSDPSLVELWPSFH